MKNKLLLGLMLIFCSFFSVKSQDHTVLFDTDQSVIKQEERDALKQFFQSLDQEEIIQISIQGHTDSDGSSLYNQSLSKERAMAVKKFLNEMGYKNVELSFYGENRLLNHDQKVSEKLVNRRTEIYLTYKKQNQPTNDVVDFLPVERDLIYKKPTTHTVNLNRATSIEGKEGTVVKFSSNSFTLNGKPVTGEVDIQLEEYYQTSDILLAGLNTMTNDGTILETGGMIKIEAFQNGKKLEVNPSKPIQILFPNRRVEDNMQIFVGTHNDNGAIEWSNNGVNNRYRDYKNDLYWVSSDVISGSKYSNWRNTSYGDTSFVDEWDKRFLFSRGEDYNERMKNKYYNGEYSVTQVWHDTTRGQLYENKYVMTGEFKQGEFHAVSKSFERNEASDEVISKIFIMNSSQLGWINCDRFYEDKRPKTDLFVSVDDEDLTNIYVVFSDIEAIMPAYKVDKNKYLVKNIPEGAKVTVLAYDVSLKGDTKYAESVQRVPKSGTVNLNSGAISVAELKTKLNRL